MQFPNVVHYGALEKSFDFSKLPNLREVTLISETVDAMHGGLPWIPMALSTLKPATTPHLSTIRLDFICFSHFVPCAEILIKDMGNDLRQAADELLRVEREFEGAVNLITFGDPQFEVAFDALGVRFRFVVDEASWSR